jgi:hypothetical protein
MSRLTLTPTTPVEGRLLTQAVVFLERVLEAADKFVQYAVDPPVPGSQTARAYAIDQREAFDLAYASLFTVEDHLRTILVIVKAGTLPCFSPFTLLRTAAEAAVRAKYLLEPALTHEQRLGRALNVRLDNLREQDKAMSHFERAGIADEKKVEAHDEHMDERLAHVEERAEAAGLAVLRGSDGRIKGLGERSLNMTELFAQFLPVGETAFRFLSGYVHAMAWVQFPRHRAQPSDDPRVALMPTDINVETFVALLTGITSSYDESIGHWMYLAGYPADVWRMAKAV